MFQSTRPVCPNETTGIFSPENCLTISKTVSSDSWLLWTFQCCKYRQQIVSGTWGGLACRLTSDSHRTVKTTSRVSVATKHRSRPVAIRKVQYWLRLTEIRIAVAELTMTFSGSVRSSLTVVRNRKARPLFCTALFPEILVFTATIDS